MAFFNSYVSHYQRVFIEMGDRGTIGTMDAKWKQSLPSWPLLRPLVAHHCNVKVIGGCKRQNDTQHSAERGEEVLRAKKNLGEPGGAASESLCFELGEDIQQTSVF